MVVQRCGLLNRLRVFSCWRGYDMMIADTDEG